MSQTALEWCCLRPSPRGAARLFGWPLALDMIGDNVRSRIVSVCLCLIVLVYYFYTSVLLLDSDNDLRNHAGFTSTVDSFTTTNVNQSSISTTTNDITSTSTTTDTAATPSTADITWLTPAQFGALALYVLTCSIGNAASQHPVIGLVGVGSTAVVAWVLWPLLSQLAHPSCPPEPMPTGLDDDSMPVSACDVYQSLRFFFALILSSLFATVALMLLFNSIKCIFVDRGLSKRERFYLQYTSDLLRRRGIHAPRNPLAEPDQPQQPEPDQQPEQEPEKQFDNDSPLISFDDVDMPPPDDDDTSLDQVQRRVPLANTSDERRMRALANADSDAAEELPACARVKAELKQTACGALRSCVTSFRQSWVREMCNVNDARIIYPIRILVAFSLSMLAFGAVIWFLVIAFDAFALLLNYLSKYAQSNGTRFVLEVIRDVVHYATYGGAVLIALALLVVWLLTLKTYRLLQLDMRRGIYKYPTPLLTNVTLFLGYSVVLQCSLVAVIVVFAIIAGVCIAIPIFYPDSVGVWFLTWLKTTAVSFVAFYLARWVTSIFLLQDRCRRPDNYRCWALIEVVHLIGAIAVGPFIAAMRIAYVLVFAFISLARMDVTMMPEGFASWDRAFMSFYAVIVVDHRLNCPVMRAFLLLASERHRPQMRWKPATRALDEFSPLLSESEREHMDSERRPIKASVRNRWWLYVTLMRNPSLRKFRRSGMMVERPGIVGRLWRAVRGSGKTTQTPPPLKQPVDEHSATVQHK